MTHLTTIKDCSYGAFHSTDTLLSNDGTQKRMGIIEKGLSWIKQNKMLLTSTTEHISWIPYIVLCLFFTSYWMSTHSLMAEMPLLVQHTPEGQDIAAITTAMSSCSFIGPLCYILCRRYIKWRPKKWVVPLILMLTQGSLQILMAFTWDVTTTISGSQHSLLLLLWAMLGYITDSIVTVQYPVFMEEFKSQYISSITVGDAIGSLLTSCIGIIQRVGENECINVTLSTNLTYVNTYKVISLSSPPLFSVTVYCVIIFITICTCISAFITINVSKGFSYVKIGAEKFESPINKKKKLIPDTSDNSSTIIKEKSTIYITPTF